MSGAGVAVVRCHLGTIEDWVALRRELWPHRTVCYHRDEVADILARPLVSIALLATARANAIGLVEAALRTDHVNGCTGSPVAFLEGLHVQPAWRGRGVARALCRAVESWGNGLGCREFASDADLANLAAHQVHRALGFVETERVVFFRKALRA